MLTEIEVRNYRALRQVSAKLRPLNVLVGSNDSGKSSFLAIIRRTIQQTNDFSEADLWRRDPQHPLSVSMQINDMMLDMMQFNQSVMYRLGADEGQGYASNFYLNDGGVPFSVAQYQLPVHGVTMESSGYPDTLLPKNFEVDGAGVPSFLDYILRQDRRLFFAIVDTMKEMIPGLEDIKIATPHPSIRRLDLVIENGLTIQADQASAGVRLLIFFISIAFHPSPPRLILLEEPETGLHPRRLGEVMTILRRMTQGDFGGHPTQVVLTTHSPYLLDCVDLDVDQVLVFRRESDGSRTAEAADHERLKLFLDEFMLGEVWFNQGEEGLVTKK